MPSWNDGETSCDDDCEVVSMDMGLMEPDTIVEPFFCGQLELSKPKCILRHMRPLSENGVNCGVVQWNCGRVLDKKKFEKQLAKLKVENDKLCTEHNKLFEDVAKMFDWRDGRVDNMNYKKAVEEEEFEKKKLEEKARLKVQMEKLKLAKEER
ncbi:hypothetical protein ZWY2020_034729 [Hordeum vulgare]|nr:hypothetical protein ZWY2020_034729 [Hordeum vulgare]